MRHNGVFEGLKHRRCNACASDVRNANALPEEPEPTAPHPEGATRPVLAPLVTVPTLNALPNVGRQRANSLLLLGCGNPACRGTRVAGLTTHATHQRVHRQRRRFNYAPSVRERAAFFLPEAKMKARSR